MSQDRGNKGGGGGTVPDVPCAQLRAYAGIMDPDHWFPLFVRHTTGNPGCANCRAEAHGHFQPATTQQPAAATETTPPEPKKPWFEKHLGIKFGS